MVLSSILTSNGVGTWLLRAVGFQFQLFFDEDDLFDPKVDLDHLLLRDVLL